MATEARIVKRTAKKNLRNAANGYMKGLRREARQSELVAIGKTLQLGKREVITGYEETLLTHPHPRKVLTRITETQEIFVLPPTGPKNGRAQIKEPTHFRLGYGNSAALTFLSGKSFPQHGAQHKTRPGEKELHRDALVLNSVFVPTPKPTPGIPIDPAALPEIGA
jgi:hypothetical protein